MKLSRFIVILSIIFMFFGFSRVVSASIAYPNVNISPSGVIDGFSISCSGTNATAILITGYPFQSYVGEYMRRPCVNGTVAFDSFDLNQYLATQAGGVWPTWFQYFHPPFTLVVKDTTTLSASDAPIYTELVRIVSPANNFDRSLLSQFNPTYPTLAVGSTFDFDGVQWIKNSPKVPLPPETIGDQNNLPANISPSGNVPRVSIHCTVGHDYTLSLVHQDADIVSHSVGIKERQYCYDGTVSFEGFNLSSYLATRVDSSWWNYVNTPIEYIIKDTTGIYECDVYHCPAVNLHDFSNNFDTSRYLASSTVWTTVGKGPIYNVDDSHTVWSNGNIPPVPTGNSSVMFFPGIMSSRLYEELGSVDCGGVLTGDECFKDNELWTSIFDSEQSKLSLNTQGKSINAVYTKDDTQSINGESETGVADEIFGFNMYKTFISDLRNWKQTGVISDYAFIPYDWRLSLNDIITNGATTTRNKLSYTNTQNFSESYILKKLQEIQKNSPTKKVTLIGHSNGGLVIKALIQKLKDTNNPLYYQIDKVIFVAVPQVGTPDAIAALLHGKEIGSGLIMDADRARQLSENMPAVYNLLPSASYFTTVDPAFAVDKVVSFENDPLLNPQTSKYGVFVSNPTELMDYILGTDGRIKPAFNNTVQPNIGNSYLYTLAQNMHAILDSWQPASTTKVIQIAGWGEETIAGISYGVYKDDEDKDYISYKINQVVDGDGTVVVPSALWISTSTPNIKRWWVDLVRYNEPVLNINRKHRDILEIQNLRELIKSEINDDNFIDQNNILVSNASTLLTDKSRLHYTLHSPLTLGITDSEGRYTGLDPVTGKVKEEIPDVTYTQVGEVQFISVSSDVAHTVKLKGYETGSFSLDVDKQAGNNIIASTSFQGIPSSTSTVVTMNVSVNSDISSSTLKIDQNGDGVVEKTLQATPNGVTIYDITPPELQVTFNIETKDVVFSAKDVVDPNPLMVIASTSITLKDSSGNTTIIPFTRLREIPTRLRLTYNKITRNGVTTSIPNTNIVYDWQEKKGVLIDLDTKATIKGVEKYVFNYKKVNNATIIKEKKDSGIITTTKSGFVSVTVSTERGSLRVSY